MSAPLWMPLHCADYIKDTRHLSTLEHGAYLLLMMTAWSSSGALPTDEKRLARLAGLNPKEWNRSRETLLDFFTLEGGLYRQKRIDLELQKAGELIEQKRAAGKASARARAQRAFNGRSTGAPTAKATGRQRDANQSQSQGSVPNGTAAKPPERSIFDEGSDLLVSAGTHSAGAARALVGKWRKAQGEEVVRAAIADAKRGTDGEPISDPAAWIQRRFAMKLSEQDAFLADVRRTYGGGTAGNA